MAHQARMTSMHRILSVFLVGLLVLGLTPMAGFAQTNQTTEGSNQETLASEETILSTGETVNVAGEAHSGLPPASDTSEADSTQQNNSIQDEEGIVYTVLFLDYEGLLIGNAQQVKQGEAAVAPEAIPAPDGQEFAGWDSDAYLSAQTDLEIKAVYQAPIALSASDSTTSSLSALASVESAGQDVNMLAAGDNIIHTGNLSLSNTSKSFGDPDPRPLLLGLPSGFVEGVDYTVSYERAPGESISAQGYRITVKTLTILNPNYRLAGDLNGIKEGYLMIATRKITVTANSASQVYTGLPLTSGYTIGGSGLAPGDTAAVTVTGSQTSVGSSANTVGTVVVKNSSNQIVTSSYAVTKVNGTLAVTKAPLIIKAEDKTVNYGSAPPAYTVTYTGFVNGENSSVLTVQPTASSTYTQGAAGPSYPITVSGAQAANYSLTYQAGTLTVFSIGTQVTVTARSDSKVYDGTELRNGNYTESGLPSGYVLTATVDGSATKVLDSVANNNKVTSVTIRRISDNADVTALFTNIVKVPGTLTITPAPLVINMKDYTVAFGDPTPAYEADYIGFVNGETPAVFTSPLVGTSAYTTSTVPGSYEITGSGAVAPNYNIAFLPATLTVSNILTSVTVTANSASKVYDGTALTDSGFTVSGLPTGFSVTATVDGSAKDVADSTSGNNPISNVKIIRDSDNLDVTGYFAHIITVNGTLTVQPKLLVIDVDDKMIEYTDPVPAPGDYTAQYSGFVNDESESDLSTLPTITSTYSQGDPLGNYPITAIGATADNYIFSYLPGFLMVTTSSDQIVISARNDSKVYDGSPLTNNGYYPVTGLPEGHTIDVTVEGSITEYETDPFNNNQITDYIIYDAGGIDVTNSFSNVIKLDGTLSIVKAPLVIRANSYAIPFGTAAPTYAASYEGFVNGETESVLTTQASFSSTYTQGEMPGTYGIDATGAAAKNYDISYQPGVLTVITNNANIVIVAHSAIQQYSGTPLSDSGYNITGLPDGFTAEVTVTGSATNVIDSTPGNNVIDNVKIFLSDDPSETDVSAYFSNISKAPGFLVITPAPLTIEVDDVTVEFGEAAPLPFHLTITGYVNGEGAAVITMPATLSTDHQTGSMAGIYAVTASGATAANYAISYLPGTITVIANDAQIFVTADSASKAYDGTPLSDSGYSITGLPGGFDAVVTITSAATNVADSTPGNNLIDSVEIYAGNENVTQNFPNIMKIAGDLLITPAPLVVKVQGQRINFGAPVPLFGIDYEGFQNGETEAVLTNAPTVQTSYVQGDDPGLYPISVSGAVAANYAISYLPATLIVVTDDGVVTVEAGSATKVYDGTPLTSSSYNVGGLPEGYTLDAVTSGSITNVDESAPQVMTAQSFDTQQNIILQANGLNEIVSVIIKDAQGDDVTESFSGIVLVPGRLIITPRPAMVIADNLTKTQGASDPTLTASTQGVVVGQTLVYTLSRVAGEEPGSYPIEVALGSNPNYTVASIPGVLTIQAAASPGNPQQPNSPTANPVTTTPTGDTAAPSANTATTPATGDAIPLMFFMSLALLSATAVAGMFIRRKTLK